MGFNRRLFLLVIILLTPFLYGQQTGYFLDDSDGEPQLFQRLFWFGDENILHYEVLIQKETNGEYHDYLLDSTAEEFINVSLSWGQYRYQVIPVDLLGRKNEPTEWRYFEILAAYQPEINSFFPRQFFLDKSTERELNLYGNNFLPESKIYLSYNDIILYPLSFTVLDNTSVKLFFNDDQFIDKDFLRGNYEIHILNPGGLETSIQDFFIGYSKPVDYLIKIAWMPVIPVYGLIHELFDSNFYLAGTALSFEIISSYRTFINFGLELSLSTYILNPMLMLHESFKHYWYYVFNPVLGLGLIDFNINLLLQKRFFHRLMALTFRIGGGYTFIYGSEESGLESAFNFNIGLSYMFNIQDTFYVEPGIDFSHIDYNNSGIIKPILRLGWQF
jgi:hypothetical protein